MRDYNFFEIYEKKKGISIQPRSTVFVCAVLMLIMILATLGLIGRNLYITGKIDSFNEETERIKASKQYVEASQLQKSIDAMKEYDQNAGEALKKFRYNNLIGTEILTTISLSIPAQASIEDMKINNAFMDVSFVVADRKTASELILNLKNTGLFQNVHLSSVALNEGGSSYKAKIQCIMKDKTDDEGGEE